MGALEDTMANRDICKPASNIWQYRTPHSGRWSNSNGKGRPRVICCSQAPPVTRVSPAAWSASGVLLYSKEL